MRSNAGPKNNNQAFKFTIREENSSYPAGQEEPLKKVVQPAGKVTAEAKAPRNIRTDSTEVLLLKNKQ